MGVMILPVSFPMTKRKAFFLALSNNENIKLAGLASVFVIALIAVALI